MNFVSLKTLRSLCLDLIIFLIPVTLLWFLLPHVLGIFAPFIAGFVLYLAARPLNNRIKRRLPCGLSAILSLSLISLFIFVILRFLCNHLIREITTLTQSSGSFYSDALPFITGKIAAVTGNSSANELFSSLFNALQSRLFEILTKFSTSLLGFAKNIPSILISVFAAIFTAFFLLKDDSVFYSFFQSFFGKKMCSHFLRMKNSFLTVTFSYLKAQLIIESIIFVVLFAGFLYLELNYALLLALVTAVVDAVPVLGTGTILIPMAAFNFLSGRSALGWGLLLLYGIALLVRQLCEPKIIGSRLGIHPLLTVFSLYTGMKLFGFLGIILGPVTAIFVKNLVAESKK